MYGYMRWLDGYPHKNCFFSSHGSTVKGEMTWIEKCESGQYSAQTHADDNVIPLPSQALLNT